MNKKLLFLFFLISKVSFSQNNQETLYIPVIFHVIHKQKTKDSISKSHFKEIIRELNSAFNVPKYKEIDINYRKDVGVSNIKFFMPTKDDKCQNIQTVFWHKTLIDSFSNRILSQVLLKLPRKTIFKFNSKKYLNIFVCKMKNKWGYATTPNMKAGNLFDLVTIDIEYFLGDKSRLTYALSHEIGHWLGLHHIWGADDEDDMSCSNTDFIDDTPSQKGATVDKNEDGILALTEIARTCDNRTVLGNYQNFMDYSKTKVGMFTKGQVKKMRTVIKGYRSGLLWKSNCNNSTSISLLDKKPHRHSRGYRMQMIYQFEAFPPGEIEDFFHSTLNYPYNAESLKRLGFYFIGRGKFEDKSTGEIITQKDIYERLNIEKVKAIIGNSKNHHTKNNAISKEKIGYFYDKRTNEEYPFIQIGNQKWMTKNLNYKTPKSRCYKDDEYNCAVYGRLYNWNEAQTACPEGWKLPTKLDWDTLLSHIGKDQSNIRSKSKWRNEKNGNNSTGLNFYPSGIGSNVGFIKFQGLGRGSYIWLADENIFGYSRHIGGYNFSSIPNAGSNPKGDLLSCRCIQTNDDKSNKIKKVESNMFFIKTNPSIKTNPPI